MFWDKEIKNLFNGKAETQTCVCTKEASEIYTIYVYMNLKQLIKENFPVLNQ